MKLFKKLCWHKYKLFYVNGDQKIKGCMKCGKLKALFYDPAHIFTRWEVISNLVITDPEHLIGNAIPSGIKIIIKGDRNEANN